MNKKFIGSTVVLVLGILSFLGAVSQIPMGITGINPLAGLVMILGALAYKSLKKRKLGIVKQSLIRSVLEYVALALIVLLIVLQNNLMDQIANDPVPNMIIPVFVFIAYGIVYFKKYENVIQQ